MTITPAKIPYLSEQDLVDLKLSTHDVIDSIEALIRGGQQGTVWSAPKAVILPGDGRYMMAALAAMDGPSLLAVKTVVLNPDNPNNGLPTINGLVTVLDSNSGQPVAIIDGNWVTAVRTAALSATAAKKMADPNASSIGFVGCGVQAQSHLTAFADLFPLKRIQVFGRGQTNIDKLCASASKLGLSSSVCKTGQAAIESVDLIVTSITATASDGPFLDASGLAKGAFAAVTDLGVPWHKDSLASLNSIVIDDLQQEATLENKLCNPSDVTGDLSTLVLKNLGARANSDDRNAFVFRGHALGDLALTALAVTRYRENQA